MLLNKVPDTKLHNAPIVVLYYRGVELLHDNKVAEIVAAAQLPECITPHFIYKQVLIPSIQCLVRMRACRQGV